MTKRDNQTVKAELSSVSDTQAKQKIKDRRYCEKIEKAVLRRAEGYQIPLKKTYKLKKVNYDSATGKKISEEEVLEVGIEEVHVPGDLRAGAYFLNNRAPDRWREHPNDTEEGESLSGIVVLPDVTDDQGDGAEGDTHDTHETPSGD